MPNVAAIRTLQDANLEIPDPDTGVNDRHFQFDLPDYVPRQSVLMFRLRALEDSTFQFRIQGTDALSHNLQAESTRTFHEIYPGGALKEAGNELILFVGAGRVAVSDILVLYQETAAARAPFAGSVINVKDYGATGNGSNDDTTALQKAITTSQPGQALYFPSGTYLVSEPLVPKADQVYFSLTDRATLKARPRPAEPGFSIFDVRSCPVEFRHLAIDGTKDKRSKPSDPDDASGIWVQPDTGPIHVVVSACQIRNTYGDGIRIMGGPDAAREPDRVIVRGTLIENCGWKENGNGSASATASGICVRADKAPVDVVVFACRIRNTHGDGIRITGGPNADRESDHVIIRDTVIEDCGSKGCGVVLGQVDNAEVQSSWFERCHNGIKMHHCHDVVVRGVTAIDNRRHGIVFAFSHRWHVVNCVARSNGSEADVTQEPGGWGIAAGGGPITSLAPNSDFTITDNICEDNAEGGITLDPTKADDPTTDPPDESAEIFPQRARVSGNVCQGLRTEEQPLDKAGKKLGSHGIHVRNSSDVVLTDNLCHHNNRSGIAVVNSRHVLAQTNACHWNLHGIGLFSREGILDPGSHVIGVNMLHDNHEDLRQGGAQDPPRSLPGVRLYGLHGNEKPDEKELPANPGTLYERHEGDQGALYVKEAGSGTEGWARVTTDAL